MGKEILLKDLLHFSQDEGKSLKVKFNQCNGEEYPLEVYRKNPGKVNTDWLFWREERRYFNVGDIAICLVEMDKRNDYWLLTTVKEVTKELHVTGGVNYEGKECEEYSQYFGRVVVKCHKQRAQMYKFPTIAEKLVVKEILPDLYDGEGFPGYHQVRLTFPQLEANLRNREWIQALESRKGVYLLTDMKSGKRYVGSATNDNEMLLGRWKNYIETKHGGNAALKALCQREGPEYFEKNFIFSILEDFSPQTDDYEILARESWWKNVLLTRDPAYGYNEN